MGFNAGSGNTFGSKDMVNLLVDTYNGNASIDHQINDKERVALQNNPTLAEAVFGTGNLQDAIKLGRTSVTELDAASKQNPQLLEFLSHPDQRALVKDGILSVAQLKDIPPEKLKEAETQLNLGTDESRLQAAKTLGLNEEQSKAFVGSIHNELASERGYIPAYTPSKKDMDVALNKLIF